MNTLPPLRHLLLPVLVLVASLGLLTAAALAVGGNSGPATDGQETPDARTDTVSPPLDDAAGETPQASNGVPATATPPPGRAERGVDAAVGHSEPVGDGAGEYAHRRRRQPGHRLDERDGRRYVRELRVRHVGVQDGGLRCPGRELHLRDEDNHLGRRDDRHEHLRLGRHQHGRVRQRVAIGDACHAFALLEPADQPGRELFIRSARIERLSAGSLPLKPGRSGPCDIRCP